MLLMAARGRRAAKLPGCPENCTVSGTLLFILALPDNLSDLRGCHNPRTRYNGYHSKTDPLRRRMQDKDARVSAAGH